MQVQKFKDCIIHPRETSFETIQPWNRLMGIRYRSMKFLIFKEYLIERETFVQIDASYFCCLLGNRIERSLKNLLNCFTNSRNDKKIALFILFIFKWSLSNRFIKLQRINRISEYEINSNKKSSFIKKQFNERKAYLIFYQNSLSKHTKPSLITCHITVSNW